MSKKEFIPLIALLAVLAAAALRPSIHGNDGVGNYVYLASLLGDGDNDYARFDELKRYPYIRFSELPVDPLTGRPGNRYGIGSALLWSPFVLAAHASLKAFRPASIFMRTAQCRTASVFSPPAVWRSVSSAPGAGLVPGLMPLAASSRVCSS
jgi:hypothetical protein